MSQSSKMSQPAPLYMYFARDMPMPSTSMPYLTAIAPSQSAASTTASEQVGAVGVSYSSASSRRSSTESPAHGVRAWFHAQREQLRR